MIYPFTKPARAAMLWLACALASCVNHGQPGAASALSARAAAQAIVRVGLEPGRVTGYAGASAVVAELDGVVELRRLGEERFSSAKKRESLHPGDQVRTASGARATILFADESTAELAELSTLAIVSRAATADPASCAALLRGVARFSVSPRAPGEGPFLVHTPAAILAAQGSVFAAGVAADASARVGVERGAVEVADAAVPDAPRVLPASFALGISARGELSTPSRWPRDDWGVWRDRAEARLDVGAVADAHVAAMALLAHEIAAGYRELERLGKQVAKCESDAARAASADDPARYQAGLPEAGAAIEASFVSARALAQLTAAHAAHATLAAELYLRHPERVAWAKLAPELEAAVLWPKRFEALAVLYLEPLRVQYYLHHPRGRAHAALVGVAIPEFFAGVTPSELDERPKPAPRAFVAPVSRAAASSHAVWIGEPGAAWPARARLRPAAPRGALAFWVRPAPLHADATLGADVRTELPSGFGLRAAVARVHLQLLWGVALGRDIDLPAPNLKAAARARAAWAGPDDHAAAIASLGGGRAQRAGRAWSPVHAQPERKSRARAHRKRQVHEVAKESL